jgi:glycosyltransferase involved in cell wall biosynthesis
MAQSFSSTDPFFLNPYKEVAAFAPDSIVVTDGVTYYTADDTALCEMLSRFPQRYTIIFQANSPDHLPQNRAQAQNLFQHAHKLVFVAAGNRELMFHQMAARHDHTVIIQNPVNLDSYEAMPLPSTGGIIHCALIGRLMVINKGQDLILAILAEERWRQAGIVVHIYGKGPDLEYLQQLAEHYGVKDKIIFEGYSSDPHSIWKQCHCLLMPSIIEGTPLTLLEAMVTGRVCIASNVGGNAEWIKDGINGFMAEAPLQKVFSDKMWEAFRALGSWSAIAQRAHEDAIARIDRRPGETLLRNVILS